MCTYPGDEPFKGVRNEAKESSVERIQDERHIV